VSSNCVMPDRMAHRQVDDWIPLARQDAANLLVELLLASGPSSRNEREATLQKYSRSCLTSWSLKSAVPASSKSTNGHWKSAGR